MPTDFNITPYDEVWSASISDTWPFNVVTKNSTGEVVSGNSLCSSISHKSVADVLSCKGMVDPKRVAKINRYIIQSAVLRAAAPDLLKAVRALMAEVVSGETPATKQALEAIRKATDIPWLEKEKK